MPEHKLSEQELQEIREEAGKLYPLFDINECTGPIDMEKKNGVVFLVRNTHIAALTRERERVKGLVEVLEWTLKIIQPYTPHQIREIKMRMKETLNNYKNNK